MIRVLFQVATLAALTFVVGAVPVKAYILPEEFKVGGMENTGFVPQNTESNDISEPGLDALPMPSLESRSTTPSFQAVEPSLQISPTRQRHHYAAQEPLPTTSALPESGVSPFSIGGLGIGLIAIWILFCHFFHYGYTAVDRAKNVQ